MVQSFVAMFKKRNVYVMFIAVLLAGFVSTLVAVNRRALELHAATVAKEQSHDDALVANESKYSPELVHLPLQKWEVDSVGLVGQCSPPKDIAMPTHCCLGSHSAGGQIHYSDSCRDSLLNNTLLPYLKAQDFSLDFLKHHSLPSNAVRQCDTCQLIHTLLKYNLSLAFEGDSMMRQTVIGLECELRRRGYNVTSFIDLHQVNKTVSWRYRWGSTYHFNITRGDQSTTIRFFEMYRTYLPYVKDILDSYNIDIWIFDHGLHYKPLYDMPRFKNELVPVLKLLAEKVKLLIWRETSTQHFISRGGYYDNTFPGCGPINESDIYNTSAHADAVKEAVYGINWTFMNTSELNFSSRPKSGGPELIFIPFRQFTIPLHDLHPKNSKNHDCSHYCSTPYLWLPIWRTLRLAMDRMVRNELTSGNSQIKM